MSECFADLHIHTNKSDSTFSPEEVVKHAHKNSLAAIAITDHDSVSAIPLVLEYAKQYNIEIIPGIEFGAEIGDTEAHILGYFIDFTQKWFHEKLEFLRDTRIKRMRQIVKKLNELNLDISEKDILSVSGDCAVGRMHMARVLMNKGYASSINEAFNRYIGKNRCAYAKKYQMTPEEAIDIIHKLGGLSVLAHPQLMNRDSLIPSMVGHGLDGIEVYHSDHTAQGVKKYSGIADKYGLLVTGGSDCHGIGKGKILIGTVKIPYALVEKMKERLGVNHNG